MKIPPSYIGEFNAQEALLIKKRVRLLCVLTVLLYSCISVISAVAMPEEFQLSEIPAWLVLIGGSILIVYLSFRANSLRAAKLITYLFVIFLLTILGKISAIYYQYIDLASSVYLLVLFLIVFAMSWRPLEVAGISFLNFFAYSLLAYYAKNYIPQFTASKPYWYFDGVLLLFAGSVFCLIIRRKETIREIENFIFLKDIQQKNTQMKNELELARRIHARLVPDSINSKQAQIAAAYLPAYYMGGDYGRFNFSSKDKLIFIICDVTGHGVSAALLVNALHREFEKLAKEAKEPGFLLKELDSFIRKDFAKTNMYLSAFCGLLDYKSRQFIYSNYGHPPQYIYRAGSFDIQRIYSQTGWLGLPVEYTKIYQDQMPFEKGDQLLLFTDGVIEAKNRVNQFYGRRRLEEFVQKTEI